MFLLEIFQYQFMVNALVLGIFTAITTAILGNFVVASRQSVVSDMLAHTALAGVGLGIFLDSSPSFWALGMTIFTALLLWKLLHNKKQAPEAVSMLLLTGGLALALLLAHLNKNNPISFDAYLFGSILTITTFELYIFIGLNILIISGLYYYWKPLLCLVFDADFLQIQRSKIFYELLLIIMIALIVGIGLKIIGGLLIGALLVIPVLIAQNFAKSFKSNVQLSIMSNVLAIIMGIIASFYLDIPASSGIVLSLIFLYLISKIIRMKTR